MTDSTTEPMELEAPKEAPAADMAALAPGADPGKKSKKNKKGGAQDGEPQKQQQQQPQPSNGGAEDEDPVKAAKRAAKLAEKEAKKAKAAAKNQAREAAATVAPSEKKAAAKAQAEARRKAEEEELAKAIDAAQSTPKGQKKDLQATPMLRSYYPKATEAGWYDWWEQSGFFQPDPSSSKPPFVIVIPPPNVTGALHIGHALTNAIQDTIVRWRRMSGFNVLWVPGTDHAGIATQTVVEKKIMRERGATRHDLGREAFLEEVWEWVEEYGDRITDQLRRLGSSVDWSRKVFTMDPPRSAAVLEAFVRMHEGGAIYRDNRLVNWDCRLKTAVSDIEVDYEEIPARTLLTVPGYDKPVEFGVLTSFAYPLEGGEGEVVVATTRVETMLGDTAVAVHPEDPRYTAMHGKFVVHPVSGRRIPIICDAELVDMAFGTGAVKVTPAHDPNDFATGKRHNLEFINVFDDLGCVNANGGPFQGEFRFKTRETIVEFLKSKGLFRGTSDNPMRLGLSSRSKDVIEPMLKPQWWVGCKDMAAASCAAVRDGSLEIIPKDFEATWFRWLENIRDWCISRQLWWGHRIPAYYATLEGEGPQDSGSPGSPSEDPTRWVVGRTLEEAQAVAAKRWPGKKVTLHQDEDVLDTWFSSGLFPFSVMGWPEQTPDLSAFYPGALLETGHDILFFWVARMVMMGLQITGKVPFKQVYLHAMVRDAHGRKMSKSLGNVIDPLSVIEGITLPELHATLEAGNLDPKEAAKAKEGQTADYPQGIEECGTDALRFALVSYTTQARDINLDIKRVVAYRHWCNKLWNAIKFAMMNLGDSFIPAASLDATTLPPSSRWILSRLNAATAAVNKTMEAYDFAAATQHIYHFWMYELCDVFIEVMKPLMALPDGGEGAAAKEGTRQALWLCLDAGLRLLHPFMPFVTEELWQRLPKTEAQKDIPSIMVAPYPTPTPALESPEAEAHFEVLQEVVKATRSLRAAYLLTRERPPLYLAISDPAKAAILSSLSLELATLSSSSSVEVLQEGAAPPLGCGVAIVDDSIVAHILLKGIVDPSQEVGKLQKQQTETQGRADKLREKMAGPQYLQKTPEEVRQRDAEALAKAEGELQHITGAMEAMQLLSKSF